MDLLAVALVTLHEPDAVAVDGQLTLAFILAEHDEDLHGLADLRHVQPRRPFIGVQVAPVVQEVAPLLQRRLDAGERHVDLRQLDGVNLQRVVEDEAGLVADLELLVERRAGEAVLGEEADPDGRASRLVEVAALHPRPVDLGPVVQEAFGEHPGVQHLHLGVEVAALGVPRPNVIDAHLLAGEVELRERVEDLQPRHRLADDRAQKGGTPARAPFAAEEAAEDVIDLRVEV